MQLHIMDCTGRSHINERDSELGDDMSQDEHSEEEMRDCDSIEADEISRIGSRLNTSINSNGAEMAGDMNEPEQLSDIAICHRQHFPTNHPLNALGSFMGIGSLHGIQNLQHNDVLEKLKMQVRDIKVGLMDKEYAAAHVAAFGQNVIPTPINATFTLPPTTMASFTHAAHTLAGQAGNNLNSHLSTNSLTCSTGGPSLSSGSQNSFSFTSPTAPTTKDVNPASNSSPSSETSNSSQQNNGWSFEEQYKQVRQLYEINDDPKRKEFLDDLFSFMQKLGKPINRLPIMAKSVLDLYELYNLVIARGGLVDVINKKLWQEIIKGLHLPSSITSAAFTLRTQYMKYLYPYECEKKNLSTPAELQAAIDGNRREGRRSSYSQYEGIHNQMQIPQITHQSLSGGLQQMSPLALVTHAASNQQAQAAAAAAAAHHRLLAPSFGQVPNIVTQEIEQRMIEYLKLIQVKKEQNARSKGPATMGLSSHQPQYHNQQQHQEQQHQGSQSPDINTREALNAIEMSRVALWQIYHNTASPPVSVSTSPQNHGNLVVDGRNDSSEAQREVLNLSDSPPPLNSIKREREREPSLEVNKHNDFQHEPPPPKRAGVPPNFYLSPILSGISAVTDRANNNHKCNNHSSDTELDEEIENDGKNTTGNLSQGDTNQRQHLKGSSLRATSHHNSNASMDNEKFDDSAIEYSPSNSAASAGNCNNSPMSTEKFNLTTPTQQQTNTSNTNNITSTCATNMTTANYSSLRSLDALNLFSGMQFCITRNGTNSNGEQELQVNLKLNGIKYSGVLIENLPNPAIETVRSTEICAPTTAMEDKTAEDENIISYTQKNASRSRIHTTADDSSETSKDIVVDMDACEVPNELAMRDNELLPNSCASTITTTTSTINQGIVPNISSNAPKHTLITS